MGEFYKFIKELVTTFEPHANNDFEDFEAFLDQLKNK